MKNALVSVLGVAALAMSVSANALVLTVGMEGEPTTTCPISSGIGAGAVVDIGDGFEITGHTGNVGICDAGVFFSGADNAFFLEGTDSFTLLRVGGGTFSLLSFDVATASAEIIGVQGIGSASSSGVFSAGGEFTHVDSFTDVADVIGVTFNVGAATFFDNFEVEIAGATPASEPGTGAVLGLGLMALGFRQRRKNRA